MHLPWTQIENEAVELAEQVGRLLGIGPDAGVGLVVKLHRWALRRSPDGDFSGDLRDDAPAELTAAALGFDLERAEELWSALVRCEFVSGPPRGAGGRVRGLPRYESAWKRNRRNSGESEDSPRGTSAGTPRKRRTSAEPPRDPRGNRGDPPSPDADADAESERGSMSSPRRDHGAPIEDEKEKGGSEVDVERNVEAFLSFAREVSPKHFGDPGRKVLEWARAFFGKYPYPSTQEAIRSAFRSFAVWCGTSGKEPGWGLWLSENVWEPRWQTARAEFEARGRR